MLNAKGLIPSLLLAYSLIFNLAWSDGKLVDPTKPLEGIIQAEPINMIPAAVPNAEAQKKEIVEISFLLTAVIISGDSKIAILNDKTVKEGDLIEGSIVQHIAMDSVVLKKEGSIDKIQVIYLLNTYADIKGMKNEKK